ncbi:methionyl-tRNA formyltransferase [Candidatus Erwinia haradaeae]|uniref:Methionyl-tRNA formyltransferase n=1 Tax=Candidatus Erwinia haradaeae TaxID=1922217 RepID=A0A451D978_9GAMM|nr:methionyl-tRNA formyltransferase [Candidatus Erwinia haradaeae]VFP82848.1 Methionyl-tRNA formyltransferase [Candidatus Erwinia haradaeae]
MSHVLKIIFAGTSYFAQCHLNALLSSSHKVVSVLTKPDKPYGRGQKYTPSPVKTLAIEYQIPILQPESLNVPVYQDSVAAFDADIIVVVSYGLILPQAILDIPPRGCINVHASLLPRWRGAAPIQRAILAGDRETGVTIMQMDAGLDTGCILHTLPCPISPTDTSATLYSRLSHLGSVGLLTTLTKLATYQCSQRIQDNNKVTYAEKLRKLEARLNWSLSALQLERCIRAFNPWPASYFMLDSQHIKVWRASVLPALVTGKVPGEIVKTTHDGIQMCTADGILNIEELQPAGKKPMTAQEFLNSRYKLFIPGRVLA